MAELFPSAVQAAFENNFVGGREVGAAVSVWQDGQELVNLVGGYRDANRVEPWTPDTLVLIWSATKGIASACALHAIEAAGLGLETRVAEFWPEFSGGGKSGISLADVLSHRAGLGALDRTDLSVLDHEEVVVAIERQAPFAEAVGGPGYGPRTFGFLVDEIVRRLTDGVALGDYWRRKIADPLGIDLWIGLPSALHHRAAAMLPSREAPSSAFISALQQPGSFTKKAFSSPGGLLAASAMNAPAARSAAIPSLGGIGSASALAKFYALLALGGVWRGRRIFGARAVDWMTTRLSQGFDKVLHTETAFSAGFMMDPLDATGNKLRRLLGPTLSAFGHPGAGGSLGFADPENAIGFGYVMNQMEPGVLPGQRAASLVASLYADGSFTH